MFLFSIPERGAEEVESRVVKPLEAIISDIHGVEYVYSQSVEGQAFLVVRYFVGDDVERSLVRLYNEIEKNMDRMPAGVSMPLVKSRSIDDVPALGLTLWSEKYSDFEIRRVAEELTAEIEKVNNVSYTKIYGGRSRELQVVLDPVSMEAYNIDPQMISGSVFAANHQVHAGSFNKNDVEYLVETGRYFRNAEDVENLVVGVYNRAPVYLKQIAKVIDGPQIPTEYVSFGLGEAMAKHTNASTGDFPAVTVSVAKRKGADAMKIADQVVRKLELLKGDIIPRDIKVSVTRNYGETASHKVNELLLHLATAILSVALIVMLAMGWRAGLVVFLSVPITFSLTLFAYYAFGYTLNRITLFALVFVTGIVVDDSIIVAENMHRHFKMKKKPFMQAAIASINEVGNPTILATFTVIAAVLPMIAVSGLMGPYMSPMPIGASVAMFVSLIVAITITPWLAYRLLKNDKSKEKEFVLEDLWIYKLYKKIMLPLIESSRKRWAFIGIVSLLLIGSMSLIYFKLVAVKMLPFDNKNEFQVVIDMPEGTTLERTAVVAKEIAAYVKKRPEVVNYQTYVGTAAPINFNGLVRHYDLRRGNNMADIQVNLLDKGDRPLQSHDIAKEMRADIQRIGSKYNANVKIAEVPPGPPVIATIVGEVYGPDPEVQNDIALQVREMLRTINDVVDVDWMTEDDQVEYNFSVDKEKAMLLGVSPTTAMNVLGIALGGSTVSFLHNEEEVNSTPVTLRYKKEDRSSVEDLKKVRLRSSHGDMVALGDIVDISEKMRDKSIFRKNQRRVVYVTADIAGKLESPVYAIMEAGDKLKAIDLPAGYDLEELYAKQPFIEQDYSIKWDGEWQITLEVFRDLGSAFAIVIVIIYILIVGWFQSFKTPIVMMVAIPLSLVGVLIGHWIMGAFFTATSMIGVIALAGIMVRNSILLVDFIELRLADGVSLKQAVIEAGAVRTTPILLTAGTVVIGAIVILFDPIFQGLAVSLMGGSITATFLTLIIVPLVHYMTVKHKYES